jgi:hypothetical protein
LSKGDSFTRLNQKNPSRFKRIWGDHVGEGDLADEVWNSSHPSIAHSSAQASKKEGHHAQNLGYYLCI